MVVAFWEAGKLLESYSLGDLGYSARNLEKTASHYHWGRYLGIGNDGRFRLAMVGGVSLVFDPQTGALVGRESELEQPAH